MPPKPQPMIALYLGATKKKPVLALKLFQDPQRPTASLPWGEPIELTVSKDEEDAGPGSLIKLLLDEPVKAPADYSPSPLPEEMEQTLANRRRIAVVLEAFGKILLFPSNHHPGGGGYGTPREGVRGDKRMSDYQLVQLARSL